MVFLLFIFLFPLYALEWQNQTGNQTYHLSRFETPSSLNELQSIVRNANSLKVKAIGEGYSLSDVGATSGILISLHNLNHILYQEGLKVKVESGISLKQLNKELFKNGLSLPNLPATDQFSLGGVINTGAHGSGHTGTLSSFIKSIDLVTADGNLITLTEDMDEFHAATVGLGALGVVYAIELECVPRFYLVKTEEYSNYPEILDQFERLHQENDFFSFFWDVKTDEVLIVKWNKSEKGLPSHESLCWYKIESDDKSIFSEIAIPFDELKEALPLVREKLRCFLDQGYAIENLHIRFVEQDSNSYLSPTFDGKKAYIAICILGEEKVLPLYQEIEETFFPLGGRPHWGKIHFLTPEKVQRLYGPNYDKFKDVRERLDPTHTFSNPFLDRIFQVLPNLNSISL